MQYLKNESERLCLLKQLILLIPLYSWLFLGYYFRNKVFFLSSNSNLVNILSLFSSSAGHINNLYNTVFWMLVQRSGLTPMQAQERLQVRLS